MGVRALLRPPATATPGLDHAECLSLMRLGAPTVSPDRLQVRRLAVFAQWRDEAALERFLARDPLGRELAGGWHVRLEYLRRWSTIAALPGLPVRAGTWRQDEPVVAVTLARMRLGEVPRFLRSGKPVERLVRDHPGVTLAAAALRPPHTISTFSVWRTVQEMEDMVHGRSAVRGPAPARRRDGRARPARLPPRVRDVPVPARLRARRVAGQERHRPVLPLGSFGPSSEKAG